MARSARLQELLKQHGIDPCNDGSCMFGPPGGMHTNGGCRCIGRTVTSGPDSIAMRGLVQRMARLILVLDEERRQHEAQLHKMQGRTRS